MRITLPYSRRHQARPGDIVDCTKRAKGLKPCPKCGKYGEVHNYVGKNAGQWMTIHQMEYSVFGIGWNVSKSCHSGDR